MNLFLGIALFALAALVFLRMPLGLATFLAGGTGLGLAAYQAALALNPSLTGGDPSPGRASASLLAAALVVGGALVPLGGRRVRKGPPRRARAAGGKSRAPTLAGLRAKRSKRTTLGDHDGLSRYDILDRVGIGGMASVFRANRREDRKVVALKIPQEKFVADAKFVRRFHREAEVLMRLSHPNIIKVFEHANEGATHYIAMEFIEGESLESFIEGRKLGLKTSADVMRLTADALRYIHKQGIIHRDIKPGNIMVLRGAIRAADGGVDPTGVKLMDFGIAAGKVLTRLTMTGARVGTPVYMSPEQARGLKIDHRSDIYSLGLVFYEMVTGTTAFKGGYEAVVHQQIFQSPPPPRQVNLEVPQPLNDLIMRMVEKDPDRRPTLTEVIEAIEGGLFEDKAVLDAPSQLVVSVNARKGMIRLLDAQGNLDRSLGQTGAGPGKLPAAPVAVAADRSLALYAAIYEYRQGDGIPNMIRKLDPDGTEVLSFGAYGMKPGELLYPISVSVGPATGEVYVLDAETCLVQRFSPAGEYLGKFGGRGKGRGSFEDPKVVVAGYDRHVYVLDHGNRQVQRFDASGEFLNKFSFRLRQDSDELRVLDGVGVDLAGNLYLSDASGSKVRTLKPDGKQGQTFLIESLQGEDTTAVLDIGVDHQGFVYAARRGGHLVRKFAPDGSLAATLETYAPVLSFGVVLREPVRELEPS